MAGEAVNSEKKEEAPFTKTSPGEQYVAPSDLAEFKDLIKKAYKKGWRLMVITALDMWPKVELIYHFDTNENILYHIRFQVDPDVEHPSVVDMFPSAFLFENEVAELMGIKIKGIEGKLMLHDDMAGMHPLRKSFKVEEMLVKLQGSPEAHTIRQAKAEDKITADGKKEKDLEEADACDFDEEEVAAKAKKDATVKAPAPKKTDEKKDGDA